MSRAKKNREKNGLPDLNVDPDLELDERDLERGAGAYTRWHWGIPATDVVLIDDPDMPPCRNKHQGKCARKCHCSLIGIGRLIRLHVRVPRAISNPHARRKRDSMIQFSQSLSSNSYLAYDPENQNQRLYLVVANKALPTLRERFWDQNPLPSLPLGQAAKIAGGRHAHPTSYPHIEVKPVGVLTGIVYFTHKKGDENTEDERSFYLHKLGEVSLYYPFLCCDARGRLFLAGGNYTAPTPGITD